MKMRNKEAEKNWQPLVFDDADFEAFLLEQIGLCENNDQVKEL